MSVCAENKAIAFSSCACANQDCALPLFKELQLGAPGVLCVAMHAVSFVSSTSVEALEVRHVSNWHAVVAALLIWRPGPLRQALLRAGGAHQQPQLLTDHL